MRNYNLDVYYRNKFSHYIVPFDPGMSLDEIKKAMKDIALKYDGLEPGTRVWHQGEEYYVVMIKIIDDSQKPIVGAYKISDVKEKPGTALPLIWLDDWRQ